jgi:hypothetical protein
MAEYTESQSIRQSEQQAMVELQEDTEKTVHKYIRNPRGFITREVVQKNLQQYRSSRQ